MKDARRREQERSQEEAAAILGARLRAGELNEEQVALLAYLEYPGASELLFELDPIRQEIAWRTWPVEFEELALLSVAPTPERFCLGAWPRELSAAARSCLSEVARRSASPAIQGDPDFPESVTERLTYALVQEAVEGGTPPDLAEALLVFLHAPDWAGQGGQAPLELQAFAPLCRILGREWVETRVREGLLAAALGAAL